MSKSFHKWFSAYLHEDERHVEQMLNDPTAFQFLILWSIFESRCFNKFMRFGDIKSHAQRIAAQTNIRGAVDHILQHFHARYQDHRLYDTLMQTQKSPDMKAILKKQPSELSDSEAIFFLVAVTYRYRNNIFHGNKGVPSWNRYRTQIGLCSELMQVVIDAERKAEDERLATATVA